jgi:hypothetical protein
MLASLRSLIESSLVLCDLTGGYKRFRWTCYILHHMQLQDYMASQPRRPHLTFLGFCTPLIAIKSPVDSENQRSLSYESIVLSQKIL